VALSFLVVCADQADQADQADLDHYWAALGAGGEYGPCNWLKDRFGVSWQVLPSGLNDLVQAPTRPAADGV
jgi:predicted 3-demethylubiquinone-9 3-methyltransferase (glyoxalase superfamily)